MIFSEAWSPRKQIAVRGADELRAELAGMLACWIAASKGAGEVTVRARRG